MFFSTIVIKNYVLAFDDQSKRKVCTIRLIGSSYQERCDFVAVEVSKQGSSRNEAV